MCSTATNINTCPTIDMTCIVLPEKKERTLVNPMDNKDVSAVPENPGEESEKKARQITRSFETG